MIKPLIAILRLWHARFPVLAGGAALALAALAAGVALAAFAGSTIAAAAAGGAIATAMLLRALGAARVILRYLERLATHAATFAALADLRVWLFRQLAPSAPAGLGFRRSGDLLGRLSTDVEALDGLYLRILVPLAGAILLVPVLAVVLGGWSVGVALAVCACFAVVAFVLPALLVRRSHDAGIRLAEATGDLRLEVVDTLSARAEILAYGGAGRAVAAVQMREATLLAAQRGLARSGALAGAGAFVATQSALLALLLAAPSAPGAALAGALLTIAAFEWAAGLPRAGAAAGHAVAAASRVLQAASVPPPVAEPAAPAPAPASAQLTMTGVVFGWRPDAPPVLDGVDLDLPEGARVALLGASGAGKSTIAALALRLAKPWSGTVRLGGTDVGMLPAALVRRQIALLTQATHLFADTVRANLLLAAPAADDSTLWAALEAARVDHVVRTLPGGLDGWLAEGGALLSGGEGRRIALARALLSPARILILDEPCAGLDAAAEHAFLADLDRAAQGRSVLLIVHRLTGVESLARAYRLANGRLVAAAG